MFRLAHDSIRVSWSGKLHGGVSFLTEGLTMFMNVSQALIYFTVSHIFQQLL